MTGRLEVPARMARLPRNKAGYVVPWFVAFINGQPDFRVVERGRPDDAIRFSRCWLCGEHLGRKGNTFVIGPMCAVNRVSPEPPSHLECAAYAARVCPFLTRPAFRRRDSALPEEAIEPAGHMIRRNPGVSLLWTSQTWRRIPAQGGWLIDVGDPVATAWYAEGREATRAEVLASIESGLPILQEAAREDGPAALRELEAMTAAAMPLVPADGRVTTDA